MVWGAKMKSIVENLAYNLAYQVLMLAIPLVTTPYLAHVLGSDAVGINSYTNSVVMLFATFGLLGISNYSNREIAYSSAKAKDELSKTFISLCIIRIFLMVFCVLCYLAMLFVSEYRYYFVLQFVTLFYNFIDISWLFVGIENMKVVVARNTVVKVISTIMIFVLVKKSSDLGLYIIINGGSACLGAFMMFGQAGKYVHWVRVGRKDIVKHIVPIFRLFIPQAAVSLYVLFDKTMIQWLTDDVRSVGFYDQSQMIAKVPTMLISAMTTVMLPRVSNAYYKGETEAVKKYLINISYLAAIFAYPFWLGMAGIAPSLVPWYLGGQFLECIRLLQLFSVVTVPIYLTNVTGILYLMAFDKTKELSVSYTAAAVFNLLANAILIPCFGAYGAVVGTVCAEFMVLFIQYHFMKEEMGDMHLFHKSVKSIFASIVMFFVVLWIGKFLGAGAEVTLLQIFAGGSVYFILMYAMKDRMVRQFVGCLKRLCPKCR
jgi:O-antigen/teichoic acid export membrane protein